jgi:hypothetical protein
LQINDPIDISFNGNHPMPGMVEAFDDESVTVVFNQPRGAWIVKVPRAWVRRAGSRWLLNLP